MHDYKSVKLEVYIPKDYFAALQGALRDVGAGRIGNYDNVLSYSTVRGTWRPLDNANPYMGTVDSISEAEEYKVEVICQADKLAETIDAIKAVHPYEEPLINAIPLLEPH